MKFELTTTYIFKLIGSISLIHALIGIALILFSIVTHINIETTDFTQGLNDQNISKGIDLSEEETKNIISQLPEIASSTKFNIFYWAMTTFGFIVNVLLIYFGYKLIKGKHNFSLAFITLMIAIFVYMHEVPAIVTQLPNLALLFGAAWGVGNMGISFFLVTHFWVWGPVLALIGTIINYINQK